MASWLQESWINDNRSHSISLISNPYCCGFRKSELELYAQNLWSFLPCFIKVLDAEGIDKLYNSIPSQYQSKTYVYTRMATLRNRNLFGDSSSW